MGAGDYFLPACTQRSLIQWPSTHILVLQSLRQQPSSTVWKETGNKLQCGENAIQHYHIKGFSMLLFLTVLQRWSQSYPHPNNLYNLCSCLAFDCHYQSLIPPRLHSTFSTNHSSLSLSVTLIGLFLTLSFNSSRHTHTHTRSHSQSLQLILQLQINSQPWAY